MEYNLANIKRAFIHLLESAKVSSDIIEEAADYWNDDIIPNNDAELAYELVITLATYLRDEEDVAAILDSLPSFMSFHEKWEQLSYEIM